MDVRQLAAITYAVVTLGVVAFQAALAFGAPLGAYAMGGRAPGRFPPALRVSAAIQGAALAIIALGVLSVAGLVLPDLARTAPWAAWLAVAIAAVSVVLNAISPSAGERRVWVPVGIVLLVTSLVVAIGVR